MYVCLFCVVGVFSKEPSSYSISFCFIHLAASALGCSMQELHCGMRIPFLSPPSCRCRLPQLQHVSLVAPENTMGAQIPDRESKPESLSLKGWILNQWTTSKSLFSYISCINPYIGLISPSQNLCHRNSDTNLIWK